MLRALVGALIAARLPRTLPAAEAEALLPSVADDFVLDDIALKIWSVSHSLGGASALAWDGLGDAGAALRHARRSLSRHEHSPMRLLRAHMIAAALEGRSQFL